MSHQFFQETREVISPPYYTELFKKPAERRLIEKKHRQVEPWILPLNPLRLPQYSSATMNWSVARIKGQIFMTQYMIPKGHRVCVDLDKNIDDCVKAERM